MEGNTNEKQSKIIIRSVIIVAILLVVFAVIIQIGYALFSSKNNKSVNITVGKIGVDLTEDTDWQENTNEYGLEKYTKKVKGVAQAGTENAYVRIKCVPVLQYYQAPESTEPSAAGQWITAPVAQEDFLVTYEGEDWIQSGEYWYYKTPIKNGQSTKDLDIKWQILELSTELASKEHLRTDVRVILEYAQAENNVWKEVFKINELPNGVQ